MKKAPMPTEEDIRERTLRWDKYRTLTPQRSTHVPPELSSEQPFSRIAAEREAVREAEARVDKDRIEWVKRNDLAKAEYNKAVRRAMIHGDPVPEPPSLEPWYGYQPPTVGTPAWNYARENGLPPGAGGVDVARAVFDSFHVALEAEERGLLHERADEWRAILEQKRAPLSEKEMIARQAHLEAEEALRPIQSAIDVLDNLQAKGEPESERRLEGWEKRIARVDPDDPLGRGNRNKDMTETALIDEQLWREGHLKHHPSGQVVVRDRRLEGRR